MINRLCCVSEPRSHRSEKRGPTTPQEHLDLGVNYFLFQLRSPKAVGRSSIHKKWNVVMEGHWEPKIRLQRWFPLSVLLAALQDHTPFLGFNIKTKTEPKFPHQLLSSAHSQEQQMLCGSQVSSAGSSQGSSRALCCLDSDCGIAALCSLWAVTRVL